MGPRIARTSETPLRPRWEAPVCRRSEVSRVAEALVEVVSYSHTVIIPIYLSLLVRMLFYISVYEV